MMQQYLQIKNEYEDCILFFRLGDFYEMFLEDAITASRELEITLTARDAGLDEKIPMCGVPYHVADTYLIKLVDKGYKVAICDQVEDPKLAKGIVKREVVRVVTPGTIMDLDALDSHNNNYLCSIYFDTDGACISYVDFSTGELNFSAYSGDEESSFAFTRNNLEIINPREIIINTGLYNANIIDYINSEFKALINQVNEKVDIVQLYNNLDKYEIIGIDYADIKSNHIVLASLNQIFKYLDSTQKSDYSHIQSIHYIESNQYMILDTNTLYNLEIYSTISQNKKQGSLIGILDKTKTAMGSRMLKKWLERPLINKSKIEERLDVLDVLLTDLIKLDDLRVYLNDIYDIERLMVRISNGNSNGKDMLALLRSIDNLPKIKFLLRQYDSPILNLREQSLDPMEDIKDLIANSIREDAPNTIREGNLIKEGFSEELDELKNSTIYGKDSILDYENSEREKTGIKNLRIRYNKILGYYFEITNSNLDRVPDYFIRKQTLVGSERFFTEELKDMEVKILGSNETIVSLEYEIFIRIRDIISENILRFQKLANNIAELDVLLSLAYVSNQNNYIRPILNETGEIDIFGGRHPVIEKISDTFIENDTHMSNEKFLYLITGPNMAGKSTYMRQIAIIALMAHIGCYVPAETADIAIMDRIFTRIGASDNLSKGESTFMVEMKEVAHIIRNATDKSLILLDEVGRGTSTYDGLSIAWSLIEYIINNVKAKTIFATHYHELIQLSEVYDEIENLTISVMEANDTIVFLRKVIKGGTNKSYGIEVAKLAGVHEDVISKANEVLTKIENSHSIQMIGNEDTKPKNEPKELTFNDIKLMNFLDRLSNININVMSPLEAMNLLSKISTDSKQMKEDLNE
ncbi:MAG: DNA mismatch repair protein MutS [Tissierellia bacterium]|nr:DNA mismatch repair protein MutS [Tissierellia bacterium]